MARKNIISAKNPPTCKSSKLSIIANSLSIVTFIMLTIIFVALITFSAKIAKIVNKIESIVDIPIKYIQKAENVMEKAVNVIDKQAIRLKEYGEEKDIPERLRAGTMNVTEKTSQKLQSHFQN